MKKRRTLIISLLLIAALALGIGYAALSRELIISSTANLAPDDSDFDIVFTEAKVASTNVADTDPSNVATASVTGTGTTANYTIAGLSEVGDNVVLTFTIQNKTTDVTASLTKISTTPGSLYVGEGTTTPVDDITEYFDKTVVVTDATGTEYAEGEDFTLAPNETATVTITVELNKTITDKVSLTGASVLLDFAGAN